MQHLNVETYIYIEENSIMNSLYSHHPASTKKVNAQSHPFHLYIHPTIFCALLDHFEANLRHLSTLVINTSGIPNPQPVDWYHSVAS